MLLNDIIGERLKVEKSQLSFNKAKSIFLHINRKCTFNHDRPKKSLSELHVEQGWEGRVEHKRRPLVCCG
jgi:hypothetical protein